MQVLTDWCMLLKYRTAYFDIFLGIVNTGTDSYGGAIVTQNGLLLIAATTDDNKFHAYDKTMGALLWETVLPALGNATPSTYRCVGSNTS